MIPYPNDPQYAATRLAHTLVLYKGNLVEVEVVSENREMTASLYSDYKLPPPIKMPRHAVLVKSIEDGTRRVVRLEDLDVNPLPLGYINYGGLASYIVRVPLRNDYRQGTRYTNLAHLQGYPPHQIGYSFFVDTINNKFPSFQDSLKSCTKNGSIVSVAWHRHWCVMSDGNIFYKGYKVGSVLEGRPVLDVNFRYLQEALDESY